MSCIRCCVMSAESRKRGAMARSEASSRAVGLHLKDFGLPEPVWKMHSRFLIAAMLVPDTTCVASIEGSAKAQPAVIP